ncbi:hypothetical protein RCL1_004766 [Eukaryota sp. TZLM3-RCL]
MPPNLDLNSTELAYFFHVLRAPSRKQGHHSHGKYQCLVCSYSFTASKTRLIGHMLGNDPHIKPCRNPPKALVDHLRSEVQQRESIIENNAVIQHLEEISSPSSSSRIGSPRVSSSILPSISSRKSPPAKSLRVDEDVEILSEKPSQRRTAIQPKLNFVKAYHRLADRAIFNFFSKSRIPFSLLRSSQYKEMVNSIKICTDSYTPPSYETVTQVISPEIEAEIKVSMKTLVRRVAHYGMSVTSDGWSDSRSRPIVNLMGVSVDGSFFLDSCDASGKIKTGDFLFSFIKKFIEQDDTGFSPYHIVQLVTDSASNCLAAGTLMESTYPWITFSRCSAHSIDLILHSIAKLEFISHIFVNGNRILKFFKNHDFIKSIVEKKSKLTLVRPGETRFATNYLVLNRLLKIKSYLKQTLIEEEVQDWIQKQKDELKIEAAELESIILSEHVHSFWFKVKDCVELLTLLVLFQKFVDSDSPTISRIVPIFSIVKRQLTRSKCVSFSTEEIETIVDIVEERESKVINSLHLASYALDPFYHDDWIHDNPKILDAVRVICEKILRDESKSELAMRQLLDYKLGNGIFSRENVLLERREVPGYEWWTLYGSLMAELQYVAQRILAQVSSNCAAERNWSVFGAIHTPKRSFFGTETTKSMVFSEYNGRLLTKINKVEYKPQHKLCCEIELFDDNYIIDEDEERDVTDAEQEMHSDEPEVETSERESLHMDEDYGDPFFISPLFTLQDEQGL